MVPVPEPSTAAPARTDELFGGGDGFAFGKDAPPEAVDFAEVPRQPRGRQQGGRDGAALPVAKGSESSVTDPNMKAVLDARANATFVQLYLDQAYAPAVGQAINDAVQTLFAARPPRRRSPRRSRMPPRPDSRHRDAGAPAGRGLAWRGAGTRPPGAPLRGGALDDDRALPAPGARALRAARDRPDRPGDLLQRLTTGTGSGRSTTSSAWTTSSARSSDDVFGGALRHNVDHRRAVAVHPVAVRARHGDAGQRAAAGARAAPRAVLRAVRAVGGHHRRRLVS